LADTKPSLSVVIPTKNREKELVRALSSVAGQEAGQVQAIVVNDGGRDVKPALARFRGQLQIDVIDHPVSLGPSQARNTAIDAAQGEYLAFLDDDDYYLPGHVKTLLAPLIAGEADLVYATALLWDRYLGPGDDPHRAPRLFDLPHQPDFLDVINYIVPSAVICRSPRQGAGRFDTDLPVVEDWELWLRLERELGYRIAHVPEATIVYHRIAGGESLSNAEAATAAKVQDLFRDCYARVCDRFPARSERGEQYRLIMQDVYDIAFAQYGHNRELPVFWYRDVLDVLFQGFQVGSGRAELLAPLRVAMGAEAD
jgi:glycosyltransferase involved in cell wall biosynthesis